jgi:methyl-accepting chemotaxis protein
MVARAEAKLSRLDPLINELNTLHDEGRSILEKRDDIPANFSVDPAGLEQIAGFFESFAAQFAQVTTAVQANATTLARAGLPTAATERMQNELNGLVTPTLQHLQNAMLTWQRQTSQIAANVRRVSAIIEDVAKDVKTVEQVRDIVDNQVIANTVRERMQEELRKAGKLEAGETLPPLNTLTRPTATADADAPEPTSHE